ncbi:MAG TPA: GGDEF domain-containing protein [Steroidobacteraceae bacterium]|nr:GGDEF domain-containing protein [Steroidobacteraceae bacterium]
MKIAPAESTPEQQLADVLTSVLHETLRGVRRAGADLAHLEATLAQRRRELEAPLEQHAFRAAVSSLIGDTQNVRVLTGELIERMENSMREVQRLRASFTREPQDALTDPLTGLANRHGFERAVQDLQRTGGSLASCALLFVDVERVESGAQPDDAALRDRVLSGIGTLIRESIKGRDIAAHLGAGEFVVLLTDTTIAGAWVVGEQLRDATVRCGVPDAAGVPTGRVTVSISVAMADRNEDVATLVEHPEPTANQARRADPFPRERAAETASPA